MKEKKHWKQYVEDEGLIKLEKISGKEASNMFFKGTKEMLMTMMEIQRHRLLIRHLQIELS